MAGLPGVDRLSDYGGALINAAPVGTANLDEDAGYRNLIAMNVAAMTQTATRAWCSFVGNAVTPTDPASNVHGAVWGSATNVKPVVAKTGTGVYTITWPTSIVDFLGETHPLSLRRTWGIGGTNAGVLLFVMPVVTAPNVVTVNVHNTAGANNGAAVTFTVFAI